MNIPPPSSQSDVQGQATNGMANLRQTTTGLPFIVFISQRDDARHAARVKVAAEPKVKPDDMGSYALDPFGFEAGKRLAPHDEARLGAWIDLNRRVLQDYWDGVIEYTEDAIAALKSL